MISKNNFFNEYLKLYSNCLNKLDMNLLSSITNLIKKKIKDKKNICLWKWRLCIDIKPLSV